MTTTSPSRNWSSMRLSSGRSALPRTSSPGTRAGRRLPSTRPAAT
jgi:hypothetical protein